MPITISSNQIHIKKQDGSGFLPGNVVAGETTEEMCAAVEATGQATIDHVNQAVADAQSAVNTLDAQKNSIAQTVASMAQLGTDTSLATPGMAADSAKTGGEIDNLKSALTLKANKKITNQRLNYLTDREVIIEDEYESSSMVVKLPENSMYLLNRIGAKTKVLSGSFSTGFPSVVRLTNRKRSVDIDIPSSLQNDWIGINSEIHNYLDLNTGIFHRKVRAVDLGTLTWTYSGGVFRTQIPDAKLTTSNDIPFNGICNKYPVVANSSTDAPKLAGLKRNTMNGDLYFYDTSYSTTDPEVFKASMSGTILYYELAKYEEFDVAICKGVDLGTLTWTYSGGVFRAAIPDAKLTTSNDIPFNGSCNNYPVEGNSSTVAPKLAGLKRNTMSGDLYFYNTSYPSTDPAVFKASMSGVELHYEVDSGFSGVVIDNAVFPQYEGDVTVSFLNNTTPVEVYSVMDYFMQNEEEISCTEYESSKTVSADGTLASNAGLKASKYISTSGRKKMRTILPKMASASIDCGLMFYDSKKNAITSFFNRCFIDPNASANETGEIDIYIPENACYFRTTMWENVTAWYRFYKDEDSKPITNTIPLNEFAENAIRRAYQFMNVSWIAMQDVPRVCTLDTDYSKNSDFTNQRFFGKFYKDEKHIGIPYTWAMRSTGKPTPTGHWAFEVGHDIDFETFVTATRYPNSYFYTQIDEENGLNAVTYGADCVGCLTYALGWPYNGTMWNDIPDPTKGYTDYIGDLTSIQNLRPCDVLRNNFHVALITDIVTVDGKTMIEVCEETTEGSANNNAVRTTTGGVTLRKLWEFNEFYSWFRTYSIYRPRNFTHITFTPNEFAPVSRDEYVQPFADLPCMPYMGNKYRCKNGLYNAAARIILIGATGYDKLVVYKDGTQVGEYTLTASTKSVQVSFEGYGTYTAKLVKEGGIYSRECEWYYEPEET